MSHGPYLYDEGPEPLHTAPSRRRPGLVLAVFGGTVAAAVGVALVLPVVNGSPDDQARQVADVFVRAVAKGDTETSYGLLCQQERSRLRPEDVSAAYVHPGGGQVISATGDRQGGKRIELVDVRWADGGTSQFTVVNESGPRVCGTRPIG